MNIRRMAICIAFLSFSYTAVNGASNMPPPPCDPLTVLFAPDSDALDSKALVIIAEMTRIAVQRDHEPIDVEAFADVDEAASVSIKRRRAESIRARLVLNGVSANRISIFVMSNPLLPDAKSDMEHAMNRRVQISMCED